MAHLNGGKAKRQRRKVAQQKVTTSNKQRWHNKVAKAHIGNAADFSAWDEQHSAKGDDITLRREGDDTIFDDFASLLQILR